MRKLLTFPINVETDYIEAYVKVYPNGDRPTIRITPYIKEGFNNEDLFFAVVGEVGYNNFSGGDGGADYWAFHVVSATNIQGDSLNKYLNTIDILPYDISYVQVFFKTSDTVLLPMESVTLEFDELFMSIDKYENDLDSLSIYSEAYGSWNSDSNFSSYKIVFGNYSGGLWKEPDNDFNLSDYTFKVSTYSVDKDKLINQSSEISEAFVNKLFSKTYTTDSGWRKYADLEEAILGGDLDQYFDLMLPYETYTIPGVFIEKNTKVALNNFYVEVFKETDYNNPGKYIYYFEISFW